MHLPIEKLKLQLKNLIIHLKILIIPIKNFLTLQKKPATYPKNHTIVSKKAIIQFPKSTNHLKITHITHSKKSVIYQKNSLITLHLKKSIKIQVKRPAIILLKKVDTAQRTVVTIHIKIITLLQKT
ncbi:hypothetical protein X975_04495, partial [Stegodyphus mimosarum]